MGHSKEAIQKGDFSEAIAKAYYTGQGYTVLTADTHETHYDFVTEKDGVFQKVQVKSCVLVEFPQNKGRNLVRIRNKRGQNGSYQEGDYDILVGVWRDGGKMFFFESKDVIRDDLGETITVCREDGSDLEKRVKNRPLPFLVETFAL